MIFHNISSINQDYLNPLKENFEISRNNLHIYIVHDEIFAIHESDDLSRTRKMAYTRRCIEGLS